MNQVVEHVKSWGLIVWVILVFLMGSTATGVTIYKDLTASMITLTDDVAEIKRDRTSEQRQWQKINDTDARLAVVETKVEPITNQSWEDWGRIKDQVQRHERLIHRH